MKIPNKKLIGLTLLSGAFVLIFSVASQGFTNEVPERDSGLDVEETEEVVSSEPISAATLEDYPVTLEIPRLGINTKVQHLGVTRTGHMAAPSNFTDVSWYKLGTIPGERGSAVMAGHEDNGGSLDGVFKYLYKLELGDDIYVVKKNGERLHFKVINEDIYPYDNAPLERIFNKADGRFLNLITCAGDWLPRAKTNDKRLVIYAELAR